MSDVQAVVDGAGPDHLRGEERPASLAQRFFSILKSINAYSSVPALIISLIAGSYGVYDVFYIKKEKELAEALSNVRASVKRITEINTAIVSANASSQSLGASIAQVSGPEKIALLSYSDSIIGFYYERPDFLDPGSYFLLATEHLNLGNSEIALKYSSQAVKLAGENRAMRAEALRIKGRALFVPGLHQDRTEARRVFEQARDVVRNFPSMASAQVELNIILDLMVSEANFGECPKAKDMLVDGTSVAEKSGVPMQVFRQMIEQLKGFSERTKACLS